VLEHLPATEVEISNGEQAVRVKNDQTGKESVVMESQLQDVRERTAEEKDASKGMSKKELDDELHRVGLDPKSFTTNKEKRAALKRERLKGPVRRPSARVQIPKRRSSNSRKLLRVFGAEG